MPARVLVSIETTALQIFLPTTVALLTVYIAKGDVEKLMNDCGVSVDKEMLNALFSALDGKNVVDVIAEGSKKVAAMPSGGGGGAAAAGAAVAEEAPKEEEKKEEEEDVDMGGLFGGDDEY